MFSSNVDFLWVLQFPLTFQPLVMSQWRTQGGLEMILFISFFISQARIAAVEKVSLSEIGNHIWGLGGLVTFPRASAESPPAY